MARAKSSKSAAIREALSAGKSASQIAQELGVTTNYVYKLKARTSKPKKAKGKPGRKPGPKPDDNRVAPQSVHAALDSAFEFVSKVGGLLNAETLISKLRNMKDRM